MIGQRISNKKSVFTNYYISGGKGASGFKAASRSHTEIKFIEEIRGELKQGDHLIMYGILKPCRNGCQPEIRKLVHEFNGSITAEYRSTDATYKWSKFSDDKLKGDILQEIFDLNGQKLESRRYWQRANGKWTSKILP